MTDPRFPPSDGGAGHAAAQDASGSAAPRPADHAAPDSAGAHRPAHPVPAPDDAALAAALADLGTWIVYPAPGDLAGRVRAGIGGRVPRPGWWDRVPAWLARLAGGRVVDGPARRGSARARGRVEAVRGRGSLTPGGGRAVLARRLAGVATLAALVGLAIVALPPGTRGAVADRLGLRGVALRYGWVPEDAGPVAGTAPVAALTPTAGLTPVAGLLDLGRRLALDEVRAAVGWPIAQPDSTAWGEPDEVYLDTRTPGGRVALVYASRPGLPALASTRVGAVLTQFEGRPEAAALGKVIGAGTSLTSVRVGGEAGYWIEGDPHPFVDLLDSDGRWRRDRVRLAGNTLLWTRGDVTLRLESALDRASALRLAESIR